MQEIIHQSQNHVPIVHRLSLGHTSGTSKPTFTQQSYGYEKEFIEAIEQSGISFRDRLIANGAIQRFAPGGKGNKDGWYVFYGLAGAFGDWRQNIHESWNISKNNVPGLDKEQLFEQIEKARKAAEEERQRKHEETAALALKKWQSFAETGSSPYLLNKKVKVFGICFDGEDVVIPLRDVTGKLWSLQKISSDGTKRFLPGGRKKGCFHMLGSLEEGKPIYVAEGFATGASIHMATQQATAVAFDAGNLESVVEELRRAYPKNQLIIAGDDDQWRDSNVGRLRAEEVAQKYGCSVVFPKFKNTDSKPTDFNDLHVLEELEEVVRQISSHSTSTSLKAVNVRELLSLDIPPREMILNPIIPEQGLVMIHAPRGIGKTHVSLMIAYAVATGGAVFSNKWISDKPNKVLFVDGEMPLVTIQERLAKIINSTEAENIHCDNLRIITPDLQDHGIADLSTLKGQTWVEEHLKDVKLLILDNYSALCRQGRENEAESWIPLQEWFLTLRRRGISVLLIHHSNKTGAQRGTSRKEDLLDTVITLKKPETYDPREGARFEVHYEKARGFYGEETIPFEAKLIEEKGTFHWQIQKVENPEIDQIITLHNNKLSQRAIAESLGLSPSSVNRRLKEIKEKEAFHA